MGRIRRFFQRPPKSAGPDVPVSAGTPISQPFTDHEEGTTDPRDQPLNNPGAETPPDSLWDNAYDSLKQDEASQQLLSEYEKLLSMVPIEGEKNAMQVPSSDVNIDSRKNEIPQHDTMARRERLQKIAESGLEHLSNKQTKVTILGHSITLQDGAAQIGNVVDWAQSFVKDAIKDVPYAPAVMAGIALVLPLLTNPATVDTANREGFTYVTSQMRYYIEMESLLLPQDMQPGLKDTLTAAVIELYKLVIEFQVRSVLRFYRNGVKNYFRSVVDYDDWDNKVDNIKEEQTRLERMFENALHGTSLQHLKNLSREAEDSRKTLEKTLDEMRELVQLSRHQHEALKRNEQRLIDTTFRERRDSLRVTDPKLDKDRIEESKGGLLKDSYRWILEHDDFQRWRNATDGELLWIKGDPGKGKTMLLCGVINELSQKASQTNIVFFFCQATSNQLRSATQVLRGLLYMFVQQQPSLIRHITEGPFDGENAWFGLIQIFNNILNDPQLHDTYIIIDALDECTVDRERLLFLIKTMSSNTRRVKWLVSSRNWPEIERDLGNSTQTKLCLELNEDNLSAAVDSFIDFKVKWLSERNKLTPDRQRHVHSHLKSKANGTFLWVALVCQELTKVPKRKFLETLETLPAGLDELYQQMMTKIADSGDVEICQSLLAALTTVFRPLVLEEIGSCVKLPLSISDEDDLKDVIASCGSFLTLRGRTVSLVHQSASDYLLQQAYLFPDGVTKVHRSIFSNSLEVMSSTLRRDIYGLKMPGCSIDQVKERDSDPLAVAGYASIYWINHLIESSPTPAESDAFHGDGPVSDFFCEMFLYWLEALSLLRSFYKGLSSLLALEAFLKNQIQNTDLMNRIEDATRFMLYHKVAIEQRPLQVYSTGLFFSPNKSLTRTQYEKQVSSCLLQKPTVEDDWDACLHTLEGHKATVMAVIFSHDSTFLVSTSFDKTVKIWHTKSGQCLHTLMTGHPNFFPRLSTDSTILVTQSSTAYSIDIWDTTDGRRLHTLEGHGSTVNSVALLDSNPNLLASASRDCTVKIWNASTGQILHTFIGHKASVISVIFAGPNSNLLASGSDDQTIKIWDVSLHTCLKTLEGHGSPVETISFSSDGSSFISGGLEDSTNKIVKIWDVNSGKCLTTIEEDQSYKRQARLEETPFHFGSDLLVMTPTEDGGITKVYDARSGKCLRPLYGISSRVFTFSHDSSLLASVKGRTCSISNSETGDHLRTFGDHGGEVINVSFYHDSKLIASASVDCRVKVWEISREPSHDMSGNSKARGNANHTVEFAEFSEDSRLLALFFRRDVIEIWTTENEQCIHSLSCGEKFGGSWPVAIKFSHDSTLFAYNEGLGDPHIWLWDTRSGECRHEFTHGGYIQSWDFSNSDTLLATAADDCIVKIWNTNSGKCQQTLVGHASFVEFTCFSSDARVLVSSDKDKTAKIWNVSDGRCLQTLRLPDSTREIALPSHFDFLVPVHELLGLWNTGTSQPILFRPEDEYIPHSAVVSNDSRLLAYCIMGTVTVLNIINGQREISFRVGKDTYLKSFDVTNSSESYLHTEIGTICFLHPYLPYFEGYHLDIDREWVCYNAQKVLWIPPEYRPRYANVSGSRICLVSSSGRVRVLELDPRGPPAL